MKLKAFEVIENGNRASSIDIYRGLAIISVVLFHFGKLPFGNLGVDLFFLVSGFLIGGILIKEELQSEHRIQFAKFFLQRGFKIWPSFYVFMVVGSVIARLFYTTSAPDQIIPLWDLKRYLFFYQNYTGVPFHWSFDHVWSLCVEEHFYILLPILFLLIQAFFKGGDRIRALYVSVGLVIVTGIALKYVSFYFTNGKDTYSATHNRIDALGWGVLLSLIVSHSNENLKSSKLRKMATLFGLLIFTAVVYYVAVYDNKLFFSVYFHSAVPFCFFLILLGTYSVDFSKLKFLRFIAYYSYNWYLWHPIFIIFIAAKLGDGILGLMTYLVVTFLTAVIATVFVEETFLKYRKPVLDSVFKK